MKDEKLSSLPVEICEINHFVKNPMKVGIFL